MTTSLKRDDLLAFMTSTSHKPLVIKVGEAAPEDA